MAAITPRSMFEKIWDNHTVAKDENSGEALLFVDRLILTDTSSFHAFDHLRAASYPVRHPKKIFGEPDHFAASRGATLADVADEERRTLVHALGENCAEFGLTHFGLGDPRMGISHVVAPEQGITLPGLFLLCGDSHTHSATDSEWPPARPRRHPQGMIVPAGTPQPLVNKLSAEVAHIVKLPDVSQRFQLDDAEAVGSSPQEFVALLKDEMLKWSKVIRDAGIKPEQ